MHACRESKRCLTDGDNSDSFSEQQPLKARLNKKARGGSAVWLSSPCGRGGSGHQRPECPSVGGGQNQTTILLPPSPSRQKASRTLLFTWTRAGGSAAAHRKPPRESLASRVCNSHSHTPGMVRTTWCGSYQQRSSPASSNCFPKFWGPCLIPSCADVASTCVSSRGTTLFPQRHWPGGEPWRTSPAQRPGSRACWPGGEPGEWRRKAPCWKW